MNIAIILSGGVGSRMGSDLPKQYMMVDGKPVIHYCMKTFLEVQEINAITIVVADEWRGFVEETISKMNPGKPVFYAQPGETRQFSIFSGLKEALNNGASDDDIVIIHDAARPMVSVGLISECIKGCSEADGVLPVIPVKDTLYQSKDGHSITSLLMSHDDILKINGSTEIAYKGGLQIKLIRGDEMNFKITTPEDLSNFDSIIRAKGL